MASRRIRKAAKPVFRAPKAESEASKRRVTCHTCGNRFAEGSISRRNGRVVASFLDPTLYFDTQECYSAWIEAEKAAGRDHERRGHPDGRDRPPSTPSDPEWGRITGL